MVLEGASDAGPPLIIVARLRDTKGVISRGGPRCPPSIRTDMALQPLGDLWFGTGFLRFRFRAPILPGFAFILGSSCRETSSCRQLIEVLGALAAQRALCRGRSETKSLSLVTLILVTLSDPTQKHRTISVYPRDRPTRCLDKRSPVREGRPVRLDPLRRWKFSLGIGRKPQLQPRR